MRPLILEYKESPKNSIFDNSIIEYSDLKNLSVIKGSGDPAINQVLMATETISKADDEPTDSDNDFSFTTRSLLDTSTETRNLNELSDSDQDFYSLMKLMATETITEAVEPTDADR